ncbi:MAG: endonuclease III, partial [Bacteriovoracaceae bacterium]
MKKKEYANFIYQELDKLYPNAHCELNHKNAFELLIATILSAQCTDVRVNMVTPTLFEKFPNPDAMAKAKPAEVEKIIHSTGFYKNKAKNIINCAKELKTKFNSEVPNNLDDLVNLPGVGKKTANVILGNAFNIASGVVVDTHVMRISQLLKL